MDLHKYQPTVKVIDEENTKLYRVRACLGTFASAHIDYDKGFLKVNNPVPLYGDDRRQLGTATVFVHGGEIHADLIFDYNSPERLSIEVGDKLYAMPEGVVNYSDFGIRLINLGVKPRISSITITRVILTPNRPETDTLPVGKVVL